MKSDTTGWQLLLPSSLPLSLSSRLHGIARESATTEKEGGATFANFGALPP